MKNIFFYILCFILIFLIFYDSFNLTKENLTKENFTNNVVVYYFNAEWCGHCKQFKPIWNEFCNSLTPADNIITKSLNCDTDKELCSKFNIEGYPTIIIDKNNEIINYSGPRTVDGLRNALNLSTHIALQTHATHPTNNKIKIFNFNTKWCGYSKKFQPIWDNFTKSIISDNNIEALNVDCDDNKELCKKYNIGGYPTVIIEKDNNIIPYSGPRTIEGLRSALDLSTESKDNKIKIYNFNTEWCGYSKKFQPTWNTFANSIVAADNIEAINVNCDDNKELCKKYNIPGYPTVVMENDKTFKIYDGPRTVEGLRNATKSFN